MGGEKDGHRRRQEQGSRQAGEHQTDSKHNQQRTAKSSGWQGGAKETKPLKGDRMALVKATAARATAYRSTNNIPSLKYNKNGRGRRRQMHGAEAGRPGGDYDTDRLNR